MSRATNILLETGTNELEIVEFFIDETKADGQSYTGYYGVNVAKVLEIIRRPQITEMPSTPHPSVLGSFNLRNNVIPLVDLSAWLGKPRTHSENDKVIVTEFNNVINGFLVSGVNRIHRLSWENVEAPSLHLQKYSGDSVTSLVRMENRVIFILDMEKIIGELNPRLALSELDESTCCEAEFVYKTLIADDSTTIRHMIGASLEKAGFEVVRTINGKMAWDRLVEFNENAKANGGSIRDHIHVIVTDIEMPGMDGHTLTRKIKQDPEFAEIPVILFSSLITESLRHKGEAVGANDQISKPEIGSVADRAKRLADAYLGRSA